MKHSLSLALMLALAAGPALALDDNNDRNDRPLLGFGDCRDRDDRCDDRYRDRHSRDSDSRELERRIREADRIGDSLGFETLSREEARRLLTWQRLLD